MTVTVGQRETAGELLDRLATDGAVLLTATLDAIEDDAVAPVPQPEEGISLAPKLSPEDAKVVWQRPAVVIDRRVRGCTPEPGAWTLFRGDRLGLGPVLPTDLPEGVAASLAPGEALDLAKQGVFVGTATGPVRLGIVRPAGKPDRDATEWARGARLTPGELLG
jgi:methionyl-tRNA formyltransferase